MSPVESILVVIPARDEAARVGAAIKSVIAATCRVDVPCSVAVVDDTSSDATAAVARSALASYCGFGTVTTVHVARASLARAAGVEELRGLVGDPARTWLLSTDADSRVPSDWIVRYLDHAAEGAVAVAGVVSLLDDCDGRSVAGEWERDYGATFAADGTHPHVHAANLGVRIDVYDEAGGFGRQERAEDIDLWRRVRRLGHRPVADVDLVVETSARLVGRVEVGFAAALRRLYACPAGGPVVT